MTNHKEQILEEFKNIGFRNQARIVGAKRVNLVDWLSKALDKTQRGTIEEIEKITKGVKHCGKKGCLLCEGADDTVAYILFEIDKLKKG